MSSLGHTKGDDWGVTFEIDDMFNCLAQSTIYEVHYLGSVAVIRENIVVAKHTVECDHEVKIPAF